MTRDAASIDITFRATREGGAILSVTRADGTTTWQKHDGARARFFVLHDLTHYAVETVLGARDGFYGLIASGWDIVETDGKGPRGPLPPEAVVVEHLVGLFDLERAGDGNDMSAEDVNAHLSAKAKSGDIGRTRALTEADILTVRARIRELHSMWPARAADGEALSLEFVRPAVSRFILLPFAASGSTEIAFLPRSA